MATLTHTAQRVITSDDVRAKRVMPHLIENNVWVPPSLQINCYTLREHQDALGKNKLSEEEIERLYPQEKPNEPI